MRADGGQARLLGGDPWTDATSLHRRLAYVPGDVTLWPNLTGGEAIDLLGRMRGGLDQQRKADLLERFNLDPRKKGRTYSKGNRQKVALIAALAANVELLILDEPTSGLDPLVVETFRQVVKEEQARLGWTVLLSSHILSEVEALCHRVTIIRDGRTVDSGSLDEMRQLGRIFVSADLIGTSAELDRLPGIHGLQANDHHVECEVDPGTINEVLHQLSSVGVKALTVSPPTLEELFLRHYEGKQHDSVGQAS
jgi:ABC-2 type transport system ATP-binding protein